MARVCDPDLGGEDENVELSLGLSIGGGGDHRKRPGWLPPAEKGDRRSAGSGAQLSDVIGASGGDLIAGISKRELHALRRQEARKKMNEKLQKRRIALARGNGEAQEAQLQSRVRDREEREPEAAQAARNRKGPAPEICRSNGSNQSPYANSGAYSTAAVAASSPFPVMPMQYHPFHPVRMVPFPNGHQYPYIMHCWAPPTAGSGAPAGCEGAKTEKNVVQPAALRSFRPFKGGQDVAKQVPSCDSDWNDGSMGSVSSTISDNQSPSAKGGSSSEARSESRSCSPLERTQTLTQIHLSPVHKKQGLTQNSSTCHTEPSKREEDSTDKPLLSTTKSSPRKPEETSFASELNIPLPPTHAEAQEPEEEKAKPSLPPLPRLPCVSTTGPNGKTLTGFLYRYTKTEVSIICVCHGRSFSPEEFVKHAGGTDVSQPLKHIVVVPSAF